MRMIGSGKGQPLRMAASLVGGAIGLTVLAAAPAAAQSTASPYTSAVRYDAERRVTGTISADPDGAGGNPHLAVRNTYDAAGRLIRVENGTLANWQSEAVAPASWSGFTVNKVLETAYDVMGRKVKEAVSPAGAPGTEQTVTQYSYDSFGRLECTAVRMNPAVFGSLPASACTLGTEGSAGPDRITRNFYDAAGQLLKVQTAVGTDVQIDYARYEYSANGKQTAVIDANGNRAEFAYDGHDRRVKWTFPSATTAGSVNAADYEEYGYDANGNRTSLRKRDGRTIAFAYDALNRVSSKTYPSGGARAVYYAYDLRGLQTAARFDSASGSDAILSTWDGFGRQASSTTSMGGVSRTLGYTSDANGNRIKVEHPDGTYAYTYHDGLDRSYYTVVNGPPVLQSYYDAQGRVYAMDRWRVSASIWGMGTTYTFDGISRLGSYGHWFQNSGANVATSFSYNPASQLVSRTRNNDDYLFDGYTNVDRSYARNGLNQYSAVGGNSYSYDANGNLTSDGGTIYTYDVENRLVSNSAGATLTYDPLGRLWKVEKGASTTQFLYDGDALVAEYDGAGNMLKRYVHGTAAGVDDPLVEYVGSSTSSPRYLFADHQGSIIAIADSNGNRIAVNGYDEYGIPNGFAGSGTPNTGRFQYTGQAWIPELGMYHYKARVYSPTLGRFLQTDPIGYDDQVNLYAYVGNDPLNGVDPDGAQSEWLMDRRYVYPHLSEQQREELDEEHRKIGDSVADGVGISGIVEAIQNPSPGTIFWGVASVTPLGKYSLIANGVKRGLKLSEARHLVGRWGRGTFSDRANSIRYHASKHGKGDIWKYLRQAANFNKKGARSETRVSDGTTIWKRKNGEFLIENKDGEILSYGGPTEAVTGSRIRR